MKLPITSVSEAESYLLQYSPLKMDGTSYTLERMQMLMHRIGDPQETLRIIHIAGTSGKTSTAYFMRALLEHSGQKTGLTVSPHIETITERVQVGGVPLSDNEFIAYLNEFLTIIEQWHELEPTYFELLIAFAYWVFAKEKVDYAVIETGLGGLLDATNVVSRSDKIAVLTPIGLDHTTVLGTTIEAIAMQKAGIIGSGNEVFLGNQHHDAREVFIHHAEQKNATLHDMEDFRAPDNLPRFQIANWQLAQSVYGFVAARDDLAVLDNHSIESAARSMPPGRFEMYVVGDKTIVLDGAHNPQKLEALIDSLPAQYLHDSTWLISLIEAPDTKIEQCAELLASTNISFICTEFRLSQDIKGRHSVSATKLAQSLGVHGASTLVVEDAQKALQQLIELPQEYVVITGSLYLVSILRPLLKQY